MSPSPGWWLLVKLGVTTSLKKAYPNVRQDYWSSDSHPTPQKLPWNISHCETYHKAHGSLPFLLVMFSCTFKRKIRIISNPRDHCINQDYCLQMITKTSGKKREFSGSCGRKSRSVMGSGSAGSSWLNNAIKTLFLSLCLCFSLSLPPTLNPSLHFSNQAGSPHVQVPINTGFTSSFWPAIPVENGSSIPKAPTKVHELSPLSWKGTFNLSFVHSSIQLSSVLLPISIPLSVMC